MKTRGQPERVEGYEPFFGLNEAPFSLAPDPRFLFASASHSAALAQVTYALQRREPLVVITGDIGTGKTLLCRTVLQQLQRKTFLSVITDPLLERDDLLKQLLQDFGIISKDRTRLTEASRHELVQTLHAFLRSLAPIQAHAVVIVDEAQHLRPDVLEQIRLLSNIDDERGTLLQIILVGQTDLEPLLSRPELRQLQQRVSRRLPLEPLNRDEVEQYIKHRLALAREARPPYQTPGATELARELAEWAGTKPGVEFAPDAIQAISRLTGGVPRVINVLCDRSLEEAYASRLRIIDGPLILAAARSLGVGENAAPTLPATLKATPLGAPAGLDESFGAVTRRSARETPAINVEPIDKAARVGSVARVESLGSLESLDAPKSAEPVAFSTQTPTAPTRHVARNLVIAASLVLAMLAIFLAVRAATRPAAPIRSTTDASTVAGASGAQPEPASAGADRSALTGGTTTGTPTPDAAAAGSAPTETATSGRFDIVVASFRTDSRATLVAAEVAALGLPSRRRVSDSWQQVVSGPFPSRTDAEEAQQRLQRAGLTGTQIVPIAR